MNADFQMETLKERTLLIVDDGDQFRQTLKLRLETQGATVLTAGTVEKACNSIQGLLSRGTRPDLIIIDPLLSGCYGLQAMQAIYDASRESPLSCLVVSSGFHDLALRQMTSLGALAYLRKPVRIQILIESIVQTLLLAAQIELERIQTLTPPTLRLVS